MLPDVPAQQQWLRAHAALIDDAFAEALKEKVLEAQRAHTTVVPALQLAGLVQYLAVIRANPLYRALGLRAEAQVRAIELGEYQGALDLYAEAIRLYHAHHDELGVALTQVTRIWALANLSRYEEAFEAGEWASQVLEARQQWRFLATLTMNLAAIHGRLGEDAKSLAMLDAAGKAAGRLGAEGERLLALVEQNRAIVLRNLGRFPAAIRASQVAWSTNTRLGQATSAARAQQNLAVTYFVLGRYNEGLDLLDQARGFFLAEGRERDALLCEISISDGLLQLRRFDAVLEKSRRVRQLFTAQGTRFEVGQAVLNEGLAYAGLGRYNDARTSLQEAAQLFAAENSTVWSALAELESAALLGRQGNHALSLNQAERCARVLSEHGRPVPEAMAWAVAARAHAALGQPERAAALAQAVIRVGEGHELPVLLVVGQQLRAELSAARGDLNVALEAYEAALQALERLRGNMMIEHRAGFLEGKEALYEGAVDLCVQTGQPELALDYAERAKSRALIDLLAFRIDLSLQARTSVDQPLVDELIALRAERDRLYRRLQTDEEARSAGSTPGTLARPAVLKLESRITELWHTLLIRNADYARDATLWQVRTEPMQPYLDDRTLLVEYFAVDGRLRVFLASRDNVVAVALPATLAEVQRDLQGLWLNLSAVPRVPLGHSAVRTLELGAQRLLQQLQRRLLGPVTDRLAGYRQLIVVPHGPLHYVPFHALHDGCDYLLESHEVTYLPSGSSLRYCLEPRPPGEGLVAFGHSAGGRLPHAIAEARAVAALWGGEARVDDAANLAAWRSEAARYRVLHLAAHGEFRADNPLFSGLALADGWLTTLELFNQRLSASLVCLSGCQTGRNVVGGGDELLGPMRAFLYAGARSLVLSLWAVEDQTTAALMDAFYRGLAGGNTKRSSLRAAQLQALRADDAGQRTPVHPYYWAPFFLVGDGGPL